MINCLHSVMRGNYFDGTARCCFCGRNIRQALVLGKDNTEFEAYRMGAETPVYYKYYNGLLNNGGLHAARLVILGNFFIHPNFEEIFATVKSNLVSNFEMVFDENSGYRIDSCDVNGHPSLLDKSGNHLCCTRCHRTCNATYKFGFCYECHTGRENMSMKKKSDVEKLLAYKGLPVGAKPVVRKEGDIWKLPKSTSPMWTQQWAYQGSSVTPYVVSHRSEGVNGSTTGEGWACSCMNFTRHTPRTDCKHILNIKLKEGVGAVAGQVKLANVDDEKLAAFEAWQREQAAKEKPVGDAKLKIFGATGRKFR